MANIKTKRLFIAFTPTQDIKFEISQAINKFKIDCNGISWVKPANLHMTLCFLGNLGSNQEQAVKQLMKEMSRATGLVSFVLDGFGAFPSQSKPRVLYIKNTQIAGRDIKRFQHLLSKELAEKINYQNTRIWKPHITIGRVKNNRSFPLKECMIKKIEYKISKFELIEANLLPAGAEYSQVASYAL